MVKVGITTALAQQALTLTGCSRPCSLTVARLVRVVAVNVISDPAEAEALISQNLMCNATGTVYQVEEFRRPISVTQCPNCQSLGPPVNL